MYGTWWAFQISNRSFFQKRFPGTLLVASLVVVLDRNGLAAEYWNPVFPYASLSYTK